MADAPQRILLLTTPHTYRAGAFAAAAERLGIEIVQAVDMPAALAAEWGMRLGLDFSQPETAVADIVAYARAHPLAAVLAVDDAGALLAARASQALALPHNAVAAAEAARDKHRMRQLLAAAGVPSPPFCLISPDEPPERIAPLAASIGFPCVVKPLHLNGSRGVIRADDAAALAAAAGQVRQLLRRMGAEPAILVEQYLPGAEVALEGVLHHGRLQVLALFDKPDPLEGPYFEETIYVTPSRLPQAVQAQIADTAAAGARALGLQTGSVHAELRVNAEGAWIVEVNGRSIGGLCSQTLRFDIRLDDGEAGGRVISLEELLLRQACGLDVSGLQREQRASGVMMIPIPRGGILRDYGGVEAARAVPGVDDVMITAPRHNWLVPLPEGDSYLGFIFASGGSPAQVEAALRAAHRRLTFDIDEAIPLAAR